jgi:phosphoenolpyruvate-protein kinase (PTS system EI component)
MAAGELYLPDHAPGWAARLRATAVGTGADQAGVGQADLAGGNWAYQAQTVTAGDVRAAFAAVAADRGELAAGLRAAGRADEASIVEIGALIAADSALSSPVLAAFDDGQPGMTAQAAAEHVIKAAEAHAAILEALADPDLAQRAGDVRQVAQAVIARLAGASASAPPDAPFILVRHEVDPVDIIRLADTGNLVGAVSVSGGASSHAAIIARGLGLPMLVGVDPAALTAPEAHETQAPQAPGTRATKTRQPGSHAILDAAAGELRTDPSPADLARMSAAASAAGGPHATSARPAGTARSPFAAPEAAGLWTGQGQVRTADGELVTVLCNVASAAETRLGLAAGAGGVGLLRTEIPFTRAAGWPSRADHLAALTPILTQLAGRRAVVRLLDFAGDKIPPFPGAEGLAAFLGAPHALDDQLAAILAAGAETDLAVMIPMVRSLEEVRLVRARLTSLAKAAGTDAPPLGMMVELAATAASAATFAPHVDFFSVGTNDLTADVLARPRAGLGPADAAAAAVLAAIGVVVAAARQAGIGLSVCGDAAADPAVLPRLLALGVRTVSVGAANVSRVAEWTVRTDTAKAAEWIATADTAPVVIPDAS